MRALKRKFILSSLIMALPLSLRAEVRELSLDQAISFALGQNLDAQVASEELEASLATFNRTTSNFYPKFGAESRYEIFDSSFERQTGATSDLFFEWNLFNGFRDWYDRKAKSLERDKARIGLDQQKLAVRSNVEAKFYKLLAASESVKVYEEALARNENLKESARKRRQAGLASDADVLEFDLYQTTLQAELTRVKSEYKQVQTDFRELLGQKDSTIEYSPQGGLTHYHVDDSLNELKDRLKNENQTLSAARAAVEQADANKRVATGGYLPQLDVKATYGSRGINETLVSPETTVMGIARWELFSGFDTTYARSQASAQVALAEVSLRKAELAVNSQVESAFIQLKAIEERVDIETENRAKAKRFYDVVASEYKRGVKNSTDMHSAAVTLLEVTLRDVQYRSEFFEQKSNLEKAVGGSIRISKGSEHGHKD